MFIGERIRKLRREAELTQTKLAERFSKIEGDDDMKLKWLRWPKTVGSIILSVFLVLSVLGVWIYSSLGYLIMYGLFGLLFALFAPGIAQTLFVPLWWWNFHVFDWVFLVYFTIMLGCVVGLVLINKD